MTNNQTIIIASLIITVGLMIGLSQRPAAALGGSFMLMQHSNTTANVGVFRIDTVSGEVSYCYIPSGENPRPTCQASGK